jgi:hypothetical protein
MALTKKKEKRDERKGGRSGKGGSGIGTRLLHSSPCSTAALWKTCLCYFQLPADRAGVRRRLTDVSLFCDPLTSRFKSTHPPASLMQQEEH